MKMRLLHIIGGLFLLCCILISARYIKYSYEINSYDVTLSFWALGPRSYINIESPSGSRITFRSSYPNLVHPSDGVVVHWDEFILPQNQSDTVFYFVDNKIIRNDGFVAEKVVAPFWENGPDSKIKSFNPGTHWGKLYHREGDYFQAVDTAYIAIAPAGESLRTYRKHFDFQQEVPYEVKELLFGVIPIRLFTRSVWPLPF